MTTPENLYRILIVEDNEDLLDLLMRTLPRAGHFVVTGATDGATGLEHFMTSPPDCVVIDVKMPGLNGYQLVRAIRGDPESATTPIVILTAMAQEQDQFTGLAAGADRYLLKPLSPNDLARHILDVIHLSQSEREQRMQLLAEEDAPSPPKDTTHDADDNAS